MNIYMKQYYLLFLALLTLVGCHKDVTSEKGDYAYFGGEIINPNSDFVILSKSEEPLDTIYLDDKNRFLYKVEDVATGFYSFFHGGEYQIVLLEPNDSIMFRLNTMDFDESLVFTGQGAKKNNYLINMFLDSEAEYENVLKYSQLPPLEFEHKLDSLREGKLKKLENFYTKNGNSEVFYKVAKDNINYNYYASKEIYPFAYYGHNKLKNLESLPEHFYDYRKNIDYNDTLIKDYYPYNAFLRYHFDNLALAEHFTHSEDKYFKRNSLCYNLDKIKLIDSLSTNVDIKNRLLFHYAIRYVNSTENVESCDRLLKEFLSRSTSENNKKQLAYLTESLKKLKPGYDFPDIKLINYNNTELVAKSLFNKPTVVYFWSYAIKGHFIESHNKVNELREKYPELKFVGININLDDAKNWKKALKQYNFSFENEYQFANPDDAKDAVALNSINKVMVVDNNGKIAISNGNMFNVNFEEQLLGLINK